MWLCGRARTEWRPGCTATFRVQGRRQDARPVFSPLALLALVPHDLSMHSRVHPKYKTKYHVGNWPTYDRALVRRGDVTLWLSADPIDAWKPAPSGRRGGQRKFSDHGVPRRRAQQPKGGRSKPCCMEDEGGPLGIGVQARVPNHLELLGSRALVVSVGGNGVARPRQVGSTKTNAGEPLMKCREEPPRRRHRAWMWPESCGKALA